jgi:hypothetical protein
VYTFCWILQRLCRKVDGEKREAKRIAQGEDGDSSSTERSPRAPTKKTTSKIIWQGEPAVGDAQTPQRPRARNMREVAMKHAITTQNASSQSRERAALASLNTNSQQETSPAIDGRPSHVESQSLKTSDCVRVAVPGSGSPSRKRRLSTANEKESMSFSSLHNNGKLKSTRGLKRKCSSSGLARPCLPCPPAIQSVSNNPAGEVTSVQDCTEGSYPIPETDTHRSVRHTDADADSVQGDIPELGMERIPLAITLAQGTNPSLLSARIAQWHKDRRSNQEHLQRHI